MILEPKPGFQLYRLTVGLKSGPEDFLFSLNETGKGTVCFFGEAWRSIGYEDSTLPDRAKKGDNLAAQRVKHIEQEFSVGVQLPPSLAQEYWLLARANEFPDQHPVEDSAWRLSQLDQELFKVVVAAHQSR